MCDCFMDCWSYCRTTFSIPQLKKPSALPGSHQELIVKLWRKSSLNHCHVQRRLKGSGAPSFPVFSRSWLPNHSSLPCHPITPPVPFLDCLLQCLHFKNVFFFVFCMTTLKKYKPFEMGFFILFWHSILLNLLSLSTGKCCWGQLSTCSSLPLSWLHFRAEKSCTVISFWKWKSLGKEKKNNGKWFSVLSCYFFCLVRGCGFELWDTQGRMGTKRGGSDIYL